MNKFLIMPDLSDEGGTYHPRTRDDQWREKVLSLAGVTDAEPFELHTRSEAGTLRVNAEATLAEMQKKVQQAVGADFLVFQPKNDLRSAA